MTKKMFKPQNVLVTGGAGFIGSNFIEHMLLTHNAIKIVNLDKLTYAGNLDNLKKVDQNKNYTFVQGDICDAVLVANILHANSIDTIVHFAAESHVDRSISGPEEFVRTNVHGTFVLLEESRKYWKEQGWNDQKSRFHHVSTDEVYGTLSKEDPAFTETTPYAPNSPYSASKAGSDHLVRAYFHTYKHPVVTTNCSNNYGPYQNGEKLIPTIIRSCVEQKAIPVYGDGTNIRDWLYVTDHCKGIERALTHGKTGEVYNIGGWNEWTNIDIVKHICKLMDEKRPANAPHEKLISFVKDRPGHDWRYAIDATKMHKELNWKPDETFETGIRKTVEWYLEKKES